MIWNSGDTIVPQGLTSFGMKQMDPNLAGKGDFSATNSSSSNPQICPPTSEGILSSAFVCNGSPGIYVNKKTKQKNNQPLKSLSLTLCYVYLVQQSPQESRLINSETVFQKPGSHSSTGGLVHAEHETFLRTVRHANIEISIGKCVNGRRRMVNKDILIQSRGRSDAGYLNALSLT